MLTTEEIKEFFRLENSHAKKELGQNFLVNEKIINDIVSSLEIKKEDKLLEIGPGLGALSDSLINRTEKYVAVEYDQKFINFLSKEHGNTNLTLVKNNILKFRDFDFNKIVGNLPYYITSDIIEYCLLHFDFNISIFMIQKECYRRICSLKGKDYNVLNVLLDYSVNLKKIQDVNKLCFFPVPTVDSVIIKLIKKENIDKRFILSLKKLTTILFHNRRKTIFNNLNSLVKDKELTTKILNDLFLSLNFRAEELSTQNFVDITKSLLNYKILKL